MQKFTDNALVNARIKVKYGLKRTVEFDYPIKENKFKRYSLIFFTVLFYWLFKGFSWLIIPFFVVLMVFDALIGVSLPGDAVFNVFLVVAFLPPLLFGLWASFDYSRFAEFYPQMGKELHTKSRFFRKTVTKLTEPVFVIPLFKNVFLEFEASRDFSKYLNEIEIVEHDFKFIEVSSNGKEKISPQDDLWKAVFKFDEIPKSGELKVDFF